MMLTCALPFCQDLEEAPAHDSVDFTPTGTMVAKMSPAAFHWFTMVSPPVETQGSGSEQTPPPLPLQAPLPLQPTTGMASAAVPAVPATSTPTLAPLVTITSAQRGTDPSRDTHP